MRHFVKTLSQSSGRIPVQRGMDQDKTVRSVDNKVSAELHLSHGQLQGRNLFITKVLVLLEGSLGRVSTAA